MCTVLCNIVLTCVVMLIIMTLYDHSPLDMKCIISFNQVMLENKYAWMINFFIIIHGVLIILYQCLEASSDPNCRFLTVSGAF